MKNGAYGIITKGLGLPAHKGLIVNHFQLGPFKIDVIIPPSGGGGGGSHPYAPGQFSDEILRPDYANPYKVKKHDHITITVRMNGSDTKVSFTVPKQTATPVFFIKNLTTSAVKITTRISTAIESVVIKPTIKRVTVVTASIKAFFFDK